MTNEFNPEQIGMVLREAQSTVNFSAEVYPTAVENTNGNNAPERKLRVLVVDDELVGLKFFHLPESVKPVLGDLTSPEVSEIWDYASEICGFASFEQSNPSTVSAFLASDALVSDVLLHPTFVENVTEPLKSSLQFFHDRAARVNKLRGSIETAFPASKFDLKFVGARPSAPKELLEYDLVVLDLVLESSGSPVDEIVLYLSALGKDAFPQRLPCIIVMSSHKELIEHQIQFSTASNISAAGLLILPKGEIEKDEFGSTGLELSYQQLDRQREVAQQMRVFMRAWTDALEEAKSKAAKAMWNLDAAAMQEIHLVAHNDNDSYDEYLNALISREYLWHVESAKSVVSAIAKLDECFLKQFKEGSSPAVIQQRFIAPFVKPQYGRDLVSHFTWTGTPLPNDLSSVDLETAVKNFSALVPFGALLAPVNIESGTECLVHITQQCDLNQQHDGQSIQFARVRAKVVKDHAIESYKDDLVARGLLIEGKEYDFVFEKGKQLALPTKLFIRWAKRQRLQVYGRLRHDIAMHFLLATANHMTRWASQKVDHTTTFEVTMYLHGDKIPGGYAVLEDKSRGGAIAVQVAQTSNKRIYFQDNTSIRIALWVAQELAPHYDMANLPTEVICNQLSVGLKSNECLAKFIHLKFQGILQENLRNEFTAGKAPKDKVNLVCVFNPKRLM